MFEVPIENLLEYWISLNNPLPIPMNDLTFEDIQNMDYDFIPIVITCENNSIKYNIYTQSYLNTSTDTRGGNCYFIERAKLKQLLLEAELRKSSSIFENVCSGKLQLTANTLYSSRLSRNEYFIVWLYSLSLQSINNIEKTSLSDNHSAIIRFGLPWLHTEIKKYCIQNNIKLPEHTNQGKLILPKGILFVKGYTTRDINSIYDLILILFDDMQYIKANYHLCFINNKCFADKMNESLSNIFD